MTTENSPEIIPASPPEKTWADVRKQRDALLLEAERQYNFDTPEEVKAAWRAYKQQLRDLPETFKDLEDLNQIVFPDTPSEHIQRLTLTR